MSIIICPGVHPPQLTEQFLSCLCLSTKPFIFPTDRYSAYSAYDILQFLRTHGDISNQSSLLFIGFSAGVVGAVGAASLWQSLGGSVTALIALDGWGVPLVDRYPAYRVSHDSFTHWSSSVLGGGACSFWADPPVAHLELWRSPDRVEGWCVHMPASAQGCHPSTQPTQRWYRLTASQFIRQVLVTYGVIVHGDHGLDLKPTQRFGN